MSSVRVSLVTVECDSADPAVMGALRDLLERFTPSSALVELPAPVAPKSPKAETKPAPRETIGAVPVVEGPPVAPPAKPLRVQTPLGEKPPVADPLGRVEGVTLPTGGAAAELERLIALVGERPGTSVHDLAKLTLGSASPHNVRRVDMLMGPAVMAGKVVRTNGRLFANAEAVAANPQPMLRHGRPGQSAPLSDVHRKKEVYNRLVAAFTADHDYPIDKLAKEVFGDAEGKSTRKIRLMLLQLCSTERLMKLGADRFRPVGDKEELGRGVDGEEEAEDDADLESNGAPDEDDDQELDLS